MAPRLATVRTPGVRSVLGALLLVVCGGSAAQEVIENRSVVPVESPEAWAMRYFAGATLMTSYGEAPPLQPGQWSGALDAASIPHLSADQQRVGFGGFKQEDLNKTPLFGRARLALGLPRNWVVELAYTPPLQVHGAQPRNVFALALGRRLLETEGFVVSLRGLGQVGQVRGDVTCPASLAGSVDTTVNPYGCRAPSRDTFTTNYYGVDTTVSRTLDRWQGFASLGIARVHLGVQVDAQVFDAIDRSRLTSNSNLPWLTVGARYAFDREWSIAAEWLYVPLTVRRPPDFSRDRDPLNSLRLQVRYTLN